MTECQSKFYNKIASLIGYCKGVLQYYLPSTDVEVHHKFYIINYSHGFQTYKILTPRKRGPCKFNQVLDQHGIDVTEKIKQFSGPSHNFHGIPTTPEMLGYSKLIFLNGIDDTVKTFEAEDLIAI